MSVSVKITGVKSLKRAMNKAPDILKAEAVEAVAAGAALVEKQMLVDVPRDSGDLASVIKTKFSRDRLSARVGPGVAGKRDQRIAGWRAHFVEFGTVKQKAQPFVYPAMAKHRDVIRRTIATTVKRALLLMAGKGGEA